VHGDGVRIAFQSESVQGSRATVLTTLQTRGGGESAIEYRMGRRDGRWAVHDVVVDGVGLADSYHAQFQRVMHGGTYADLVARLHEKASDATLIALAKARTARAAAAPTPTAGPPPVRVASVAPASDAPPVESRAPAPITMAAVAVTPPVPPPTPRPVLAAVAPPAPASRPQAVEERAAAPAAPAPSARKSFWIQVGAFRSTDAATRLVERLRTHRVTVSTGGQRSAGLARVLVGPFTNRSAATATLRELVAGGYRAFIALE
jgi:cell division septation protein DedD